MVKEREGMETYKQPQFADTWPVSLNMEVLQSVRIMLNNVSDALNITFFIEIFQKNFHSIALLLVS